MVRLALVMCCIALVACGGTQSSKPDAGDASTDVGAPPTTDAPQDQADTPSPLPDGGTAEVAADVASDIATDVASDIASDVGSSDAAEARADASEVSVRVQYRAIAIASGRYHTCALLDDHRVKCWGDNGDGQLGQGDKKLRGLQLADMGDALPPVDLGTGRTAKVLAAGRNATCVILDTDELKCWGLGPMTGLPGQDNRGDNPGEMGDALPVVNLGVGRKARGVAISYWDVCVERDDGKVRCWGINSNPAEVSIPGEVQSLHGVGGSVMAILTGGSLYDVTADTPYAPLTLSMPIRSVSGAASTWCLVTDDDRLMCQNVPAVVAPPASARVKLAAMTESGDFSTLLADGTVRTWRETNGVFPWAKVPASDPVGGATLSLGQPAQTIVGGGSNHTCALLADGTVKCWSKGPSATENAIGSGPNDGIDGTIWRAVNLGTRPE